MAGVTTNSTTTESDRPDLMENPIMNQDSAGRRPVIVSLDPPNTPSPVQVAATSVGQYLAVTPEVVPVIWGDGDDQWRLEFTGGWRVTHRPSGVFVAAATGRHAACVRHAMAFARALAASGVDWSTADPHAYATDAVTAIAYTLGEQTGFAGCATRFHCTDTDSPQRTGTSGSGSGSADRTEQQDVTGSHHVGMETIP